MGVFYTKSTDTKHILHKRKRWNGCDIDKCQICDKTIQLNFIYGRIRKHVPTWMILCITCASIHAIGIGFDKGYTYRIQVDDCYYKV